MVNWFRSLLKPPVFDTEEKTQLARLLHPIILASVLATGIAGISLIVLRDAATIRSSRFVGLSLLNGLIFFWLLRRGHVRFVSYAIALMVWALCSAAIVLTDGLQSSALGFFSFTVIYAFLLLGQRTGFYFLALAILTLVSFYVADRLNLLPNNANPLPGHSIIIVQTLILSVSGWVVDIVTRNLRQSLQRARAAEQQLRYKSELQALITQLSTEFVNLPTDEIATNIQHAMEKVSSFVGADLCRFWTVAENQATIKLLHEWHVPEILPNNTPPIIDVSTIDSTWLAEQFRQMQPVYIPVVDALPAQARALQEFWQRQSIASTLQVPLISGGRLAGVISFSSVQEEALWSDDVTQLLTMAGTIFFQALARQQAEAQHHALIAERERTTFMQEFLGNVTHDLKNPLAVIRTNLYLARKVNDLERQHEALDTIDEQANRINALIDDLLLLIRLDSEQPLTRELIDLLQLLTEVTNEIRPLMEEKKLAFTASLSPDLPSIWANNSGIRRVFINLLENAIRYTPQNHSVQLTACLEADAVIIEVIDTGIGIPVAELPRVFDRFYRATNAFSASEDGTGLGLAIVQRIVTRHGGAITVESEEGQGSKFRVALPTHDQAATNMEAVEIDIKKSV